MRAGPVLSARATAAVLVTLALAVSGCGGGTHHASATSSIPPASTPTSTTAPAPAPSARAAAFGADVDQTFLSRTFDAVGANRQLAAAAADGLGLARAAPLWEFTEPEAPRGGQHRYDWRFADFIAGRLAAHGFRWVAVLGYSPGWASETPAELHGAPTTPADFAAYAEAVARRYRGLIAAYEIWNEENSSQYWRPAPDPAAYAQLYLAARAAIHRVDPGVPVLIGGLADPGNSFLAELLQHPALRGQIDGVAVHPYGRNPEDVLGKVRGYRLELRFIGAGDIPLYVTEYGWATEPVGGPTYATAAQQGPFLSTVAEDLLRSDCNVRMVIFYAWTTAEHSPTSADQWYGVASPDGAGTSATAAVAEAARALIAPAGATVALCGG